MVPPRLRTPPAPAPVERKLSRVHASMVSGLPEPTSPEAAAWLEQTLAALQEADPRPDVDLGSIEARLAALEGRPLASPPFDPSGFLARLGALEARLAALERAAAIVPTAPPEPPPVPPTPEPVVIRIDPLDPAGWADLASAKAALTVMVTQEAAWRCGHPVELYEDMCRLDALGEARSRDEDLRLMQHEGWAKERQQVELARLTHNAAIRALESVENARRYDWRAGWPAFGESVS